MNTMAEPLHALDLGLSWRNRFAALGPAFSTAWRPTPLPAPYWVGRSRALAQEMGLPPDALDSQAALEVFTGNLGLAGSAPLASVYSGHQFGVWAGQLGDGRAVLLGEVVAPDGQGLELQLKGCGRTPYSRMGDGRAVLRSSIREFLCSEAMHALGIPTSRALCVTGSDAPVRRETVETAAVVTRVAPSFIRFGHFEHFAHSGQQAQLRQLADFVIDAFYPGCRGDAAFDGNPYAALLAVVAERTAAMVAHWQAVGFCHGVMNTDNMSILGLTVDYGPFQFLDAFDPGHVCNHSDSQGRYAFHRQPAIAHWNLYCLGEALLPLIGTPERTVAALETYKTAFARELMTRLRTKLGWRDEQPGDGALVDALLQRLAEGRVDYTIFWRRLSHHVAGGPVDPVRDLFADRAAFDTWLTGFAARAPGDGQTAQGLRMLRANPAYVLRNHLAEQAIRSAKLKDFSEVQRLLALLEHPFDEQPGHAAYADFPPDWAASIEISCSS